MKGLEEQAYLIPYIISNIIGAGIAFISWRWPRTGRWLFVALFGGASLFNLYTANTSPEVYMMYGDLSAPPYSTFIHGWFSRHISAFVSAIAVGQGLIAIGMLMHGWWVRIALMGSMLFLAAIAPLGVGAALPFSLSVSIAALLISRRDTMRRLV